MDMTMQLSRTVKGQEEIFNLGHTLRPRHRQILFSVGKDTAFDELRNRLPNCADLEAMVDDLLQSGFIQALRNMASSQSPPATLPGISAAPTAPAVSAQSAENLEAGRSYVLEFIAALVGTKSPVYRQMSEVQDLAGFNAVLPGCRRVIAAVASPHQAAEMEAGAAKCMAAETAA